MEASSSRVKVTLGMCVRCYAYPSGRRLLLGHAAGPAGLAQVDVDRHPVVKGVHQAGNEQIARPVVQQAEVDSNSVATTK